MRFKAGGSSFGLLSVLFLLSACGGGSNASGSAGQSSTSSGGSTASGSGGQGGGTVSSGMSPTIGGCAVFPSNHIFNTPIDSFPVHWYEPNKDRNAKGTAKGDTVFQSYVSLHRKQDFVMPLEVEIKFDNAEKIREHWDGQSRWTRFSYQKRARVVSAEIDPDHTVQLDSNNFNNSYTVEPDAKPAHKVANYWLFLTQCLSQALGWWAV